MTRKTHLKPGCSIVLCCYNSADVIVSTIQALSKQEIPKARGCELIVVDNNCTDNTIELVKHSWEKTAYPLKIVKESRPGLIHARKTGVANAGYDKLLFVDDDNILAPNWIYKLDELYTQMPEVGAIGGYNEALIPGRRPEWFDTYQHVYACGSRSEQSGLVSKKLFGAGFSFRTQVITTILFSDLPLFLIGRTKNILSRGEDTEMAYRCLLMGWNIYYDSSLLLQHNLLARRLSWNYVCKAVKGGGVANVILRIYKHLFEKKKPLTYTELVRSTLQQWKQYSRRNRQNLFRINKEGTDSSFWFYWLLGMSLGLIHYRTSYTTIQQKIVDYYS